MRVPRVARVVAALGLAAAGLFLAAGPATAGHATDGALALDPPLSLHGTALQNTALQTTALQGTEKPEDHNPFEPWDESDPDVPPGAEGGQGDEREDAVLPQGQAPGQAPAQGGTGRQAVPEQVAPPALAETGFDLAGTASAGLFAAAAGLGLVRLSRREAFAPRR